MVICVLLTLGIARSSGIMPQVASVKRGNGAPLMGGTPCDYSAGIPKPDGGLLPVAPSILSWVLGTPYFSRRVSL
jgi:hypothetical protein